MEGLAGFFETFFNADVAARYLPDILAGMGITIALGVAGSWPYQRVFPVRSSQSVT